MFTMKMIMYIPIRSLNRHMSKINGQFVFDEFMNISEEQKTCAEIVMPRTQMLDPCYYCLCNSCINNAESVTITPDEIPDDWNPCFFCDMCRKYDGKSMKNMEREECSKYVIDNHHALLNRKKIKIMR